MCSYIKMIFVAYSQGINHTMSYIPYNSKQGELVDTHLQNPQLTNIVESYLFTQRFVRIELPDNADANVFTFLETHNKNCVLRLPSLIAIWEFYFNKKSADKFKHRFDVSKVQQATDQAVQWIKLLNEEGILVLDWFIEVTQPYDNINLLFATYEASNDTWYMNTKHKAMVQL